MTQPLGEVPFAPVQEEAAALGWRDESEELRAPCKEGMLEPEMGPGAVLRSKREFLRDNPPCFIII